MRDATHTPTCSLLACFPSSLSSYILLSQPPPLSVSQLKLCTGESFCLLPLFNFSPAFSLSLSLVSAVLRSLTSSLPNLLLSYRLLPTHLPLLFDTQYTLQETIKQTILMVSLRSITAQRLHEIEYKLCSGLQHL